MKNKILTIITSVVMLGATSLANPFTCLAEENPDYKTIINRSSEAFSKQDVVEFSGNFKIVFGDEKNTGSIEMKSGADKNKKLYYSYFRMKSEDEGAYFDEWKDYKRGCDYTSNNLSSSKNVTYTLAALDKNDSFEKDFGSMYKAESFFDSKYKNHRVEANQQITVNGETIDCYLITMKIDTDEQNDVHLYVRMSDYLPIKTDIYGELSNQDGSDIKITNCDLIYSYPDEISIPDSVVKKATFSKNGIVTYKNVEYSITSSKGKFYAHATGFANNKSKKKVVIPAEFKYCGRKIKVTSISKYAFSNCKKLQSVEIGTNVTRIGREAFSNCKKLKSINIKTKKIKTLGRKCFNNCNKNLKIKLPKGKKKAYKKMIIKAIKK